MKLENIAYLFTVIGGGWGYTHDLFVITTDDKLYYTEKFNDNLLDCELAYVCDLYGSTNNLCIRSSYDGRKREYLFDLLNTDGKVDFEDYKEDIYGSMDALEVTLYKNENNTLKKLTTCYGFDSIPAVRYVSVLFSKHKSKIKG